MKERRKKAAEDRAAAKDAKAARAQELAAKREANLARRKKEKEERLAAALREHEQTHVGPGGEKGWALKYDAKDRYPYWEHKETKESKWVEDDEVAAINAMVDALKAQG